MMIELIMTIVSAVSPPPCGIGEAERRYALGLIQLKAKKTAQGLSEFERAFQCASEPADMKRIAEAAVFSSDLTYPKRLAMAEYLLDQEHPRACDLLTIVADAWVERGDLPAARERYRRALEECETAPLRDYAEYRLGWVLATLGQTDSALSLWLKHLARPSSTVRPALWPLIGKLIADSGSSTSIRPALLLTRTPEERREFVQSLIRRLPKSSDSTGAMVATLIVELSTADRPALFSALAERPELLIAHACTLVDHAEPRELMGSLEPKALRSTVTHCFKAREETPIGTRARLHPLFSSLVSAPAGHSIDRHLLHWMYGHLLSLDQRAADALVQFGKADEMATALAVKAWPPADFLNHAMIAAEGVIKEGAEPAVSAFLISPVAELLFRKSAYRATIEGWLRAGYGSDASVAHRLRLEPVDQLDRWAAHFVDLKLFSRAEAILRVRREKEPHSLSPADFYLALGKGDRAEAIDRASEWIRKSAPDASIEPYLRYLLSEGEAIRILDLGVLNRRSLSASDQHEIRAGALNRLIEDPTFCGGVVAPHRASLCDAIQAFDESPEGLLSLLPKSAGGELVRELDRAVTAFKPARTVESAARQIKSVEKFSRRLATLRPTTATERHMAARVQRTLAQWMEGVAHSLLALTLPETISADEREKMREQLARAANDLTERAAQVRIGEKNNGS